MPPKRKAAQMKPAASRPAKKQKTEPVKQQKQKQSPAKKQNTHMKQDKKQTEKTAPKPSTKSGPAGILSDCLKDAKWKALLGPLFEEPYFKKLEETLSDEYKKGKEIFPPKELIFNAFNLTPFDKVKVVILGQDPYHDNGQAMGLSFSVPEGIQVPPSLKNIYKELARDPKIKGFKAPDHGCLTKWAQNGVLLLNATLTVEAHKPNSHAKFGWQKFTDSVIKLISDKCDHVGFILWGGFAHKKEKLIDRKKHVVVMTAHPSPLSANKFTNCNCFSACNDGLVKLAASPQDWSL